MSDSKALTWLESFANQWLERLERGREPHAVLLLGPPGVGKRSAASWLAQRHLGLGSRPGIPEFPVHRPEHADFRWIGPPEDKHAIGIEQIRALIAEISLTSYEGTGKAAIIAPANAMTTNAANSLLKTLEEPPGNTLLVLVADRVGRLPATIMSRCQRIEILPPDQAEALAWLDRVRPGTAWGEALAMAGNAPLAAIDALEHLDSHATMQRDFQSVAEGRVPAVTVAASWAGQDPKFTLDWLARQVQGLVASASGCDGGPWSKGIRQSVLERMDRRNLFCYLDIINRLRAQPAGSFNVQLALESLLIDLADGLKTCCQRLPADGMRHMLTESRAHE